MWEAKILVYDEKGVYATLAKKFNVDIHGYMLNYYSDKKHFYFTLLAFIDGNEESRKKIIKELKKDKRVDKIEDQESYIVCRLKEENDAKRKGLIELIYNPLLIQIKPFIVFSSGWEELELASFEREHLEKIIKIGEKELDLKLKYIKKQKLENLGILSLFPKLTTKQREIIESAISNGYYEYPRKKDVKTLAKERELSFSTFQEHLRKAENKLIPFAVKKAN